MAQPIAAVDRPLLAQQFQRDPLEPALVLRVRFGFRIFHGDSRDS
jgi:hypothetical protein